jgi:orotidine-5'-phosphate decarboxylase
MAPLRFRTAAGIVPALDADALDLTKRVVAATTGIDGVVAYKLGLTAVLRLGLAGAVRELRGLTDLPIVYDHQKAGPDIPDMAGKFAALCREAGVDGLILFPIAGPRAVAEFAGQALAVGLLPIVGGELPLRDYRVSDGGYIVDDALERIIVASLDLGVDHFVVPAADPARVARLARWLAERMSGRPSFLMPGIGALGGTIAQSFAEAPNASRYAVVGRAIYAAPDPAEAAKRLAGEALEFA